MRLVSLFTIGIVSCLVVQVALASPKEDIDTLKRLQASVVDLANDFLKMSQRFQESRDVRSSDIALNLANSAQIVAMSLDQLKDTVVAVGVLQCDNTARRYFRDMAQIRFRETVPNILDQRARDVSTWISFSQDNRLIAQASRLRDKLRELQETLQSMGSRYI